MAGYLAGVEIVKEMLRKYPPSKYPYLYGITGLILKGVEPLGHNSPYSVWLMESYEGKKRQSEVAHDIPTKEEAIAVAYTLEDYLPMEDVYIVDQSDGRTVWRYSINAPTEKKKRYALCYTYYHYTGEPQYDIRSVYFSDSLENVTAVGKRLVEHTGGNNFVIVDRTTKKVLYSFNEVPPEEYEMWGNFYV
jgi:glucose dehydrogenase